MALYQHIVLATDFSAPAGRALDLAVDIARRYGARVHALHIVALNEIERPAAERQIRVAVPAACDDVVAERTVMRAVAPELGIVQAARDFHAELIVMGTHGHTGLRHVLLGSVAQRVVHLAPCSVLTVRPADFVVAEHRTDHTDSHRPRSEP